MIEDMTKMMAYEENAVNKDEKDYTKPTLSGFIGPINLGSPQEISILELAHTIIKLTGSKTKIYFESLPQDDPKMRHPDIALAREKLKWKARISLDVGLQETVNFFKGII